MMKGLAEFTKTTLIGGVLIVLPIYVSILLLVKTIAGVAALIAPVTAQLPAALQFRQVIAMLVVILVCFLAGLLVRTGPGLRAKNATESNLLERIPGYALIRGLAARVAGRQEDETFNEAIRRLQACRPGYRSSLIEQPTVPGALHGRKLYIGIPPRLQRFVWALLAALLTAPLSAPALTAATTVPEVQAGIGERMAPVEVDGVTLFRVAGIQAFPAEERARAIADRIKAVAADLKISGKALRVVDAQDRSNILIGERLVMSVFDVEADIEGVPRQILAEVYQRKISEAINAYRQDRSPRRLAQAALHALGASVMLLVALWLGRRVYRLIDAGMERRYRSKIHGLEIQSFEIVRAERIWGALRGLVRWSWVVLVLLVAYLYLHFVLGLFPWTRALAGYLLDLLVNPLRKMGTAFIDIIPDLVFLAILFIITRYALKVMRLYFSGIAEGTITPHGFERDWAWPTYRMVRLLIIVFALVVAYPYIPGSETDAFKGISIFLGVIFSLGSSSVIANIIAGYTMIYRRAFTVGDRVQIGDHMGDVVETRLLVTYLRTLKNEVIVVPNSVIMNSEVINYSTLARQQGLILHTTVGIGYETSWRQVEAMLLEAARRTHGLLQQPPPFVLQKSLGDFAVTYEINAYCDQPSAMAGLYAALHQNILDVFNEYGVQIMTPAYEGDPEQPKVVPKDQWFTAPAKPPMARAIADER